MPPNSRFGSGVPPPTGLLDPHVGSFAEGLRVAGYPKKSLNNRRRIARAFVRWAERKKMSVVHCDESHVAAFLGRSPRGSKHRVRIERAAVRLFLRHIHAKAGVPNPPLRVDSTPADTIERRYVDYLRTERGLAENSILVYSPYIHDFLTELMAKSGSAPLGGLDALTVQDFLLDRVRNRSSEWSRLLGTALRSFLRFLYARGEMAIDLSLSVPMVRRWRLAAVPTFLSPEDVGHVLSATDRSTPRGRRDYAILLLLARLGLRAGEVVLLELGDIRWRTGEIVVRGKGRALDRLPLLPDIGKALALYLRKDRGARASRRVFLRMIAPRVGLAGPAAVGHIVRAAIARAGLRRTSRGAAHIFRHSLATRMIRHGASIAEISEVLRHRSQNTTEIYAKVDFEALRGVARSWPVMGGAR